MPETTEPTGREPQMSADPPPAPETEATPEVNEAAPVAKTDYTSARILILMLVLLTLAVFATSLSGGFVHDDWPQIAENAMMGNWDGETLSRVFTRDFWAALRPEQVGDRTDSLYYRPVFSLFLMLGYEVAGRNPLAWHVIVILLHAAAAVAAFAVLNKSLAVATAMEAGKRRLLAAFAAGVFVAHPAQAESVAWISGLVGPLSALLMLAAFYCYLNYRERRRPADFAGAVGLFALAVLAKENALALIPMVAAYELWVFNSGHKLAARARALAVHALPFVLAGLGYFALRYNALGMLVGRNVNFNFPDDATLTLADNLRTLPALLMAYVKLAAFPVNLSLMYDLGYVRSLSLGAFWLPLVAVLAVAAVLWRFAKQVAEIRLAVIWMALPLLPHLNTRAFVSDEIIHDRYLYLSILGLGLLVGAALMRLRQFPRLRLSDRNLVTAAVMVLTALGALTAIQNAQWQNNYTAWERSAGRAPGSRVALTQLGLVLEAMQQPVAALDKYEAALRIHPDIVDALNNSAFVYARGGRWEEATRRFERIVELTPDKATARFNLSFAYAVQKRFTEAAHEQRAAIELSPGGARAEEWRARLSQIEQAIASAKPAPGAQAASPPLR